MTLKLPSTDKEDQSHGFIQSEHSRVGGAFQCMVCLGAVSVPNFKRDHSVECSFYFIYSSLQDDNTALPHTKQDLSDVLQNVEVERMEWPVNLLTSMPLSSGV